MERQCAAEGVVGDEEQPQPEKAQSDPDPATNTSSSREEPQPTRTAFKTPRGHGATPASPPSRPDGSHQGKPKTPAGEEECPPTRQRRGAVAGRGRWGRRAFFGCVVCMLFFLLNDTIELLFLLPIKKTNPPARPLFFFLKVKARALLCHIRKQAIRYIVVITYDINKL
jgi:hypothetical protein